MTLNFELIILLISSYILGSIPFGLILSKAFGHGDLRKIGSGNIGATNALRTGSKKLAISTLILDMAKGAIPVLIFRNIYPNVDILFGFSAILGHCFPIWLKFKGGKGVATTLGSLIAISPILGTLVAITWLIMALTFKISSLSALISILLVPLYTYFILTPSKALWTILITILVWERHKSNIVRLLKREESKIGSKGKK